MLDKSFSVRMVCECLHSYRCLEVMWREAAGCSEKQQEVALLRSYTARCGLQHLQRVLGKKVETSFLDACTQQGPDWERRLNELAGKLELGESPVINL